jgi:hypothetical protein
VNQLISVLVRIRRFEWWGKRKADHDMRDPLSLSYANSGSPKRDHLIE